MTPFAETSVSPTHGVAERVADVWDQSRRRITERFLNHFGWHSAEEARASLREDAARAGNPGDN